MDIRWILILFGVVGGLLGLVYLGVSYKLYDTLSRITPGCGPDAANTPRSYKITSDRALHFDTSRYWMPDYQTIRFSSRQAGLMLSGWYVPAAGSMAPAVIITHGLNGCKGDENVLTVAGMLHRNGFNVLLYDMREHGESDIEDGRASLGIDEHQDLLGAWDWLVAEKHFPPNQIGVYGESLGAGTTLIAFGQEPRIAAAFVDSPYADLPQIIREELVRNRLPTFLAPGGIFMARLVAGDDLLAHSPLDAIRNAAGRPIYIIHGTLDDRISVNHTRQLAVLAQQVGANVTTWLPEGIGHVEAEFRLSDEYEQRLVQFFRKALGA